MAFRIFLDTDVLLDFTLKRSSYPIVRSLMEWAINGRVQLFISSAILRDIGTELRKAYGAAQAKEVLLALLASAQMIDSGHETAVSALQSRINNIAGAISYHTALHHRLDYFITWDSSLLEVVNPVLPVTTPIEFINRHAVQPGKIN
ncbi:MAG TPA: PIN domain-containing protein [Puia sp.]|nr:PIN domain-containing protein [Puia sp.]